MKNVMTEMTTSPKSVLDVAGDSVKKDRKFFRETRSRRRQLHFVIQADSGGSAIGKTLVQRAQWMRRAKFRTLGDGNGAIGESSGLPWGGLFVFAVPVNELDPDASLRPSDPPVAQRFHTCLPSGRGNNLQLGFPPSLRTRAMGSFGSGENQRHAARQL